MIKNIAVLASGSGTNAENIVHYFRQRETAVVSLILTNRRQALVRERAERLQVPCFWLPK